MSNYCAQLPPHARLIIHGRPKTQKSPYGSTQGPKFTVFEIARIQTIFEDVEKAYRRLTDVWVGLTEPLGQKSISFNNLLWENGKRYYHGTGAI